MNRSRFAYFLNAIHYCIWLNDIKFGDFLRKFSGAFMSLVLTICFTKKFKRRQEERMAKVQKIMTDYQDYTNYGYTNGYNTVRATADVASGWAGAAAGASWGADIGACIGASLGIGGIIGGGIIGGAIGGVAGSFGASWIGTGAVDGLYGR